MAPTLSPSHLHIISRLEEERMGFELADTKWYKETYNVADSDGLQDPMDVEEDDRWDPTRSPSPTSQFDSQT